jgi:DNA-binding NarL/FixJ family response regulator
VLVVDDHPALRAGLVSLLAQEKGIVLLGALRGESELTDALDQSQPDVVVLDYALERGDGLRACFRIKQVPDPPGVVLYSGYVDDIFAVPAALAGADAIVSKSAPVDELLTAIRDVAGGQRSVPSLDRDAVRAASSRLPTEDLPVAGMLFARISVDEIGETLDMHPTEVRSRALRMIGELQARDRSGGDTRRHGAELAVR